jgi:hypothetical protein
VLNRVTTTATVSIVCDNEGENARECRRQLSRKKVKEKSVEEERVKERGGVKERSGGPEKARGRRGSRGSWG